MIGKGCGGVSRFRRRCASVAPDAAGGIARLGGGGARSGPGTGTTGSSTDTLPLRGDHHRSGARVLFTHSRLRQVHARSPARRGVVLAAPGVSRSVPAVMHWAGRHGSSQQDAARRFLGLALKPPVSRATPWLSSPSHDARPRGRCDRARRAGRPGAQRGAAEGAVDPGSRLLPDPLHCRTPVGRRRRESGARPRRLLAHRDRVLLHPLGDRRGLADAWRCRSRAGSTSGPRW